MFFVYALNLGRHFETTAAIFQTSPNKFWDHKLFISAFLHRFFPPIPLIRFTTLFSNFRRSPVREVNPSLPHTSIEILTGTENQGGDGGAIGDKAVQERQSRQEESDLRAGISFRLHSPRTPALLETFPSSWQSQMHSPTVMTLTSDLCHPEAPASNSTATDQPTSPSDITPQRRSRVFLISDLDLNEVPTLNTPTVINFSASATATV